MCDFAAAIDANRMTVSPLLGTARSDVPGRQLMLTCTCICVQVLRAATGDPAEGTFLTDIRKQKIDKLLAEYVKRAPK